MKWIIEKGMNHIRSPTDDYKMRKRQKHAIIKTFLNGNTFHKRSHCTQENDWSIAMQTQNHYSTSEMPKYGIFSPTVPTYFEQRVRCLVFVRSIVRFLFHFIIVSRRTAQQLAFVSLRQFLIFIAVSCYLCGISSLHYNWWDSLK